ncbi:hypothetical protein HYPSUDRAFT_148770, partial [Hypholoma sublateritium FD-334 SS-4]
SGVNKAVEDALMKKFPPVYSPAVLRREPCIITDQDGNIMLWYLPRAIALSTSIQGFDNLQSLERSLRIKNKSPSWRVKPDHFRSKPGWLKAGNVSLSPAWFQQAHENTHQIEVSAELSKEDPFEWLALQVRTSAIIGGILSIVHPEQYAAGIQILRQLHAHPGAVKKGHKLAEILQVWSAPFNVVTVISNRETPFHRDNGADHTCFDILLALGEYQNGRLEFPGLGLRLKYDSGTVAAFSGRILQHGATCGGNRACVVYHSKAKVMKHFGASNLSLVNVSLYCK